MPVPVHKFMKQWNKQIRKLFQCANYSMHRQITNDEQSVAVNPVEVLSDPKLSYQDVFYILYEQARKTMLLHVNTDPNINQSYLQDQLQSFCSSFGKVVNFTPIKETPNYFLAEFLSLDGIKNLSSVSSEGLLTLRMAELSPSGLNLSLKQSSDSPVLTPNNHLMDRLRSSSTISEQMIIYYEAKRASSDCIRKMLFLPSLFEDFFNWHMKTDITAIPFGTSFSGFCHPSSDVDISLTHLSDATSQPNISISSLNQVSSKTAQMYKTLQRAGTNSVFAEACKHIDKYFPGVTNVTSFDALFPLITFYFTPFQMPVDISFNNRPGVQSSWTISMYTRHDKRVAPYLFLIREWAKQCNITRHGGPRYEGLTPYMMTCFGLFYLMRCQPSVIPSMMDLFSKQPSPKDIILGGFRTKYKEQYIPGDNKDSVEDLFMGFLHYYKNFDFQSKCISLSLGKVCPSHNPTLEMKIPFTSVNVGKSCSIRHLNKFQESIANLLRKLEIVNRKKSKWGILSIIDVDADT